MQLEVTGGAGVRLHVREAGTRGAQPIVFIHGWSQSELCWQRQFAGPLVRDHHLVAFDLRGHGMSEKPEAYADARLWADDLAAVIRDLQLDRPILVAWSYGGFVVGDYLRIYGDDGIAGINLVGAGAILRPPQFEHVGPGFLENAEGASSPDLATNIAAIKRFLRACTNQPLDRDQWDDALCWNLAVPSSVRGALIAREIDASDSLAQLTVPVLVSHGRADQILLPSMAAHTLDVCPTAEPSWYDDVGHMPFVEATERFDRELADFVSA
jgi:pimeloyl-ACP methyl ester carboxylesterase